MSLEFQLGYGDHLKVEDFLARSSTGVAAISLHPKAASFQIGAAEAARAAGVAVLFDPRTERLAHSGATLDGIPGYTGTPYDLDALARSLTARQTLVDTVLAAHPDLTTVVTPPFFFAGTERVAQLNLALAEAARLGTDKPVRPVLLLKSKHGLAAAAGLASDYAAAGFAEIDLRFTPFGGENESLVKIQHVLEIADLFRGAGIRVLLGRSGNLGQAAFALGRVDGYSVGLGELERVDHAGDIARQSRPPQLDEHGKRKGGQWEGVYLPGPALTLSRKRAEALLAHSDVRTRLGCRIGACGNSLLGPVADPKAHYLHARAAEMAALEATPGPWRPKTEADRLRRALELRDLVNDRYRAADDPEIKTRTLHSLLDAIEHQVDAAAA